MADIRIGKSAGDKSETIGAVVLAVMTEDWASTPLFANVCLEKITT